MKERRKERWKGEEKKFNALLTLMPFFNGLGRFWYDENFLKFLETWVKLMRTIRTWPCSIKVHEIDIHQVFVQMRQLHLDKCFRFSSHTWDQQIKLTETNESNSCFFLPYHIFVRLIVGAQFLDFCSLWLSRSLFSTYIDRGSKSARLWNL